MSYFVLFFLIISGYVFAAPIFQKESLKFSTLECISGNNETSSKYIVQVFEVNETCIRVNSSSSTGNEVYLYIIPEYETNYTIEIKVDNCSTPLPNLHLSVCNEPNNVNQTGVMVTFEYENVTLSEVAIEEHDAATTTQSMFYTGPTVYETLHRLDFEDEEDEHLLATTNATTIDLENTNNNNNNVTNEILI
ncbi:unnamed protein product [Adineta steineri]|uniref:Uncharacterized protein n=1 Tax=Adineta steineri TaxID=433720 RepID=A0A814VN51_9BILA|nr:unnamed protein product [Adineta steineri]CAF1381344.1 unnamed protein product [Adineta steineri]